MVGAFARGRTVDPFAVGFALSGVATVFDMKSLDAGFAARHKARNNKDVKAIWVNYSGSAGNPQVTITYEPNDANGKPTGTPYDAAATKTFIPTIGWQQVTFDTLPTVGRTPGGSYSVVLATTTGGTTANLRSQVSVSGYPVAALTSSSAPTRSSFTLVSGTAPICVLILEDDSIVAEGMCPYAVGGSAIQIYGTRAVGIEFTLASPAVIDGLDVGGLSINGSPSNLLAKIFSGSSLVSGALSTNLLTEIQSTGLTRTGRLLFDNGPVTFQPGTYRAVIHQSDTGSLSTNRYNLSTAVAPSADLIPASLALVSTLDVTAPTITWTKTATETPAGFGLIFSDLPAGSGGTQMPIIINI